MKFWCCLSSQILNIDDLHIFWMLSYRSSLKTVVIWFIYPMSWNNWKIVAKVFFSWIPGNVIYLMKTIINAALKCLVSSTLQQCFNAPGCVVNAVLRGWMVFQCHVTTPISAQCHSCKQSHGSVLADLTKSALPATKKRSEIVSGWCQGLI